MRFSRRIAAGKRLAEVIETEYAPGDEVQSDEEVLEAIRQGSQTIYHPVGTCKMGMTRLPSSMSACVCAASAGCAWSMHRSCRR